MNKADRALELFGKGFNCAQAVAAAFGPDAGVDEETALAMASAFGGGMCRQGDACGAVTGGLLVIGLQRGRITVADPARKAELYEVGQEFMARFKARHNTVMCRELLGCDISTPEGAKEARERGFHQTHCSRFVRDAAEILEAMETAKADRR